MKTDIGIFIYIYTFLIQVDKIITFILKNFQNLLRYKLTFVLMREKCQHLL